MEDVPRLNDWRENAKCLQSGFFSFSSCYFLYEDLLSRIGLIGMGESDDVSGGQVMIMIQKSFSLRRIKTGWEAVTYLEAVSAERCGSCGAARAAVTVPFVCVKIIRNYTSLCVPSSSFIAIWCLKFSLVRAGVSGSGRAQGQRGLE